MEGQGQPKRVAANFRRRAGAAAGVRGQGYALLAAGFRRPGPQLVAQLLAGDFAAKLREVAALFSASALEEGLRELYAASVGLRAQEATALQRELALEYDRVFVGAGHLPAPPYESVYRDPAGLVMGEPAVAVAKQYQDQGLSLAPTFKDLPDHAAVELEFMAYLCYKEAAAWEKGDVALALTYLRQEGDFLSQHLTQWLDAFAQRTMAATETPFYRALAKIAPTYVALDRDWALALAAALGNPRE